MADPNRERDLVLAPNEFAFISDQTKGHIIAYVGPYKTSLANTDKPVVFDQVEKRFVICNLDESIQTFTTAPEGWYIVLKNPPIDGKEPKAGTSNNTPELNIGRKVNIPGPTFFALWPGQMARVIKGHHLRSNQYLAVRVYDEEQARKNWNKAVIKAKGDSEDTLKQEQEIPDLIMGQMLVIKGTEVSFYIPPTGIEVVPDAHGNYIREAVTLERLEYCILLDENGNKRYIEGPDVVFPEPTETFIAKSGTRKFRAIELNENSGVYVKVIAPYEEDGTSYSVGDELFITGKELKIYIPRKEHAMIKYGDQDIYHAVAIPPGEGRYYLNRNTGQVSLMKGPSMFLPDPRESVIVRRILTAKQVQTWFPGNYEALEYNMKLQKEAEKNKGDQTLPQMAKKAFNKISDEEIMQASSPAFEQASDEIVSDAFSRSQSFTKPRTITLDTKYEGAVTIGLWNGYACQVVSRTGTRKVIVGPATYLLEYDENLQTMDLSTGTPKSPDATLTTVYLRISHNKVSDIVYAESKDFCKLKLHLSFRVNFTGPTEKWFEVENYVKFLTDHMRSVLRSAVQRYHVSEFYMNAISLIRDIVLGKPNENGKRAGRMFEENGMHIYDVEVFEVTIADADIATELFDAQHAQVKQKLELEALSQKLELTRKQEEVNREIMLVQSATRQANNEMQLIEYEKQLHLDLKKIDGQLETQEKALDGQLQKQKKTNEIGESELLLKASQQKLQLEISERLLQQKIAELRAEVEAVVDKAEAVSPDLVAALQAYSDRALAQKLAETMAPLSIIGGKSIVEVFGNLLKGSALENVLMPPKGNTPS